MKIKDSIDVVSNLNAKKIQKRFIKKIVNQNMCEISKYSSFDPK